MKNFEEEYDLTIRAKDKEQAIKYLNSYLLHFKMGFDFCECCGERWSEIIDTETEESFYLRILNKKIVI